MSDEIPSAVVHGRAARRRRISLIWAVPLVTVLVAGWLAWDTMSKRGPRIEIRFDAASGLQANQSRIRYRDVELGAVEKIALGPDRRHVVVTARMTREAEPLLNDKTRFWVVKPRFFAGAVSGLETLVSGSYIQLEPAGVDGAPATSFVGLEDPPVVRAAVPGTTFRLQTRRIGSLNQGSPILFRDMAVGEVLGWDVSEMAKDVIIHAFVRAPYDRYVHEKTLFWNASGAAVQLGGAGVKLELESLRALVLGGIAFSTPENAIETPPAPEGTPFPLHADRQAAETAAFDRSLKFVSYFKGSVAGLAAGGAVTLHGLRIGGISEVSLRYDQATDDIVAEVHYGVEPDRIARLKLPHGNDLDKAMEDLVRRGLRTRLESASIVTGAKQLAMDVVPTAPAAPFGKEGDAYVIPPLDGDTGDIAASAAALVARLHTIPFEQIGDNLNKTLEGASGTANDPKLRQAIGALSEAIVATQTLVTALNKGADPLLRRLPAIAASLEQTISQAGALISSLGDGRGGSQLGRDTNRLMSQLSEAARSVRILAEMLARHPEALIRGRADQEVR